MNTTTIDEARVEAFARRLFGAYVEGMLVLMVDVANRTGLLEAMAAGPGTSTQLAERAGLEERYVRECLGALVTGGIATYDPDAGQYALPPEHAVCLTGATSTNLAPLSRVNTLLAHHVAGVSEVFATGGGIPYDDFRPGFTDVMDGLSRGTFDNQLIDALVPLADGLHDRLDHGSRVADIGCGTGHSTNVLAAAYPASTFVGYDLADDAIERARTEAADTGLPNVSFQVADVLDLPADPPFDVVFAFDAIHDQADPAGVLHGIHRALAPGGLFVMMDVKASSHLENNLDNPFAPWLYGVSTLHCMTVSLAQGGAGLGTVWGVEQARAMLADAGFVDVAIHDVPDDPFDVLYVAHKPTG